jgi:hypothetical protein
MGEEISKRLSKAIIGPGFAIKGQQTNKKVEDPVKTLSM